MAAHYGDEAGMMGAALMALESLAVSGRLVVCPTPIGNLEDITLRVLVGAARGRRGGLRGHAPDARAARPVRGEGAARLLPRAQRAGALGASWWSGCATGRWWRWCRRRDAAASRTRGTCSCAPAWRRGCRWRCCRGRRRRSRRWWRPGCPRTSGTSTASCRARRASCARCSRASSAAGHPSTLVAFESPRRLPATLALLAELDPAREAAVCRELTKVHEEIVRGTAAELAARYADGPPKGEVVLVVAPPGLAGGRLARPARTRGPPHSWSTPAPTPGKQPPSSPPSPAQAQTRCTAHSHPSNAPAHLSFLPRARRLSRSGRTVGRCADSSSLLIAFLALAAFSRGGSPRPTRPGSGPSRARSSPRIATEPIRTRRDSTGASTSPRRWARRSSPRPAARCASRAQPDRRGSRSASGPRDGYDTSYLHLSSLVDPSGRAGLDRPSASAPWE